ncbi:MAG: hypothetical protein ACLTBV_12750 [Enterocloster bolteae]
MQKQRLLSLAKNIWTCRKNTKTVRSFERRIKKQDKELAGSRREIITVRNQWFEVFGNLEKEFNQKRSAALKEMEQFKNGCSKRRASWMRPWIK